MRRRPSATTAIACLALFFALAGTGLAAGKYLITSKSQIKPSVLKELRGNRGPAGAPGAAGAAGAAGPQGTVRPRRSAPTRPEPPSRSARAGTRP